MALGCPHPDYLMDTLSSRQWAEWQAFYQMEPFGDVKADWRAGMLASVLANVNRGKGTKAFHPEDFMPKPPLTPKEQEQKLRRSLAHLVVKKDG